MLAGRIGGKGIRAAVAGAARGARLSSLGSSRLPDGPGLRDFLTDTFARPHSYLRISLTERCNLRCTYCMPEDGVDLTPDAELLTNDEIVRLASVFARHGVDKVRLTGGEPSIRRDLPELISGLRGVEGGDAIRSVGMTSNGIALIRKVPDLVAAGLTSVNLSLDTLVEGKFSFITRRRGLHRVLETAEVCAATEGLTTKINCVVMRGLNDDEIPDFVDLAERLDVPVRFIEYMPFGGNAWSDKKFFPYKEMLEVIERERPGKIVRDTALESASDTTKYYVLAASNGSTGPSAPAAAGGPSSPQSSPSSPPSSPSSSSSFASSSSTLISSSSPSLSTPSENAPFPSDIGSVEAGETRGAVGFITSMSDHFCGTCNRLRITADGNLKVCLFGNEEVSLRDVMREGASDEELIEIVGKAVKGKSFSHGGMYDIASRENRPMIKIGG